MGEKDNNPGAPSLFRAEVIDAQRDRLFGEPVGFRPVALWIPLVFLLIVACFFQRAWTTVYQPREQVVLDCSIGHSYERSAISRFGIRATHARLVFTSLPKELHNVALGTVITVVFDNPHLQHLFSVEETSGDCATNSQQCSIVGLIDQLACSSSGHANVYVLLADRRIF